MPLPPHTSPHLDDWRIDATVGLDHGLPVLAEVDVLVVGLGAAVAYLEEVGMEAIAAHEHELTAYALEQLQQIEGLRIIGPTTAENRGSAVSFVVEGIHPHDLGQVVDDHGVCIRVGHHCAWPAHTALGVQATARASFYLYNEKWEIDALVEAMKAARSFFGLSR